MGQPRGQRGSRDRQATPEEAVGAAGHAARRGRLAAPREGPAVRHLALLVAGASAGLPGRRAAARPAARAAADDRPPDPRHIGCATTDPGSTTTTTTWRGWRWRWSGPAGCAGVEQPEGAEEAVRAVPQRVGARGRRRHPVAQAGPVLQRPGQRARRRSSWPATTTGCGGPSRWPTGSTRR